MNSKRLVRVKDSFYTTLTGIPTLVANIYRRHFIYFSLKMEFVCNFSFRRRRWITNAGKQTITSLNGAVYFDSATVLR